MEMSIASRLPVSAILIPSVWEESTVSQATRNALWTGFAKETTNVSQLACSAPTGTKPASKEYVI